MVFKGLKMEVNCSNWEQIKVLGDFWDEISLTISINKLVGLGFGWNNNHFCYAIGFVDDFKELEFIQNLKIENTEYIEISLPNETWKTKKGKASKLREIYENNFDCYSTIYKYELERFDGQGNCEISVLYENYNNSIKN